MENVEQPRERIWGLKEYGKVDRVLKKKEKLPTITVTRTILGNTPRVLQGLGRYERGSKHIARNLGSCEIRS